MPRPQTRPRHNLPAHRVRLIGREDDLAAVGAALLRTEGRLLSLTGTGGCGKTRLALELSAEVLPHFQDGVWLVELAAVGDPGLVPQAIVSALELREQPGETLVTTLVRALAKREVLLVLDNCEHLIAACAEVVEHLLDHCPRLRVLVTSREALQIAGEITWRVPPLAVADQHAPFDALLRAPAVQLFVERAQAARPEVDQTTQVATIAGICSRLDGMPLAIELAAAWVRTLAPEQILHRLDDSIRLLVGGSRTAPSRQQALRATLDWSYRLLDVRERTVFHRVSVFSESCSLDAMEAVCADGLVSARDVLEVVTRLVDKSLVLVDQRDGQSRYRLLEPVRQYADGLLAASGERELVRRRHACYYQAFAEERAVDTNFGGARRFAAMHELGGEYANLRAVLAWSLEAAEPQVGLSVAWSLLFFWQHFGRASEGLHWVARLLEVPGAGEPTYARAGALLSAAFLAMLHGDLDLAQAHSAEAVSISRRLGETLLEWNAHLYLGLANLSRGEFASSRREFEQARLCARAVSAAVPEAESIGCTALSLCDQGDYAAAQPLAERGAQLARMDPWSGGWALMLCGRAALGLGELERARSILEVALAHVRQHGEPQNVTPTILQVFGELEIASGRLVEAQQWLARSVELRHVSGERWFLPRTFDRLAYVAALCSEPERALKLAGAAERIHHDLGSRRTPPDQALLDSWLPSLRDRLGAATTDALLAEGRALDLDDAVACALSVPSTPVPDGRPPQRSVLSPREQEVAVLLARGFSNPQIARELVISAHTASRHVENILGKLGFSSRTQVATWAVGQGLIAAPGTEVFSRGLTADPRLP